MDPVWAIVIIGVSMTLIWAVLGHKRGDELAQAQLALDEGKPVRAEMKARRALRIAEKKKGAQSPEAARCRYLLARAMVAGGELEQATEEFARAREAEGDTPLFAEERKTNGRFLVGLAIASIKEGNLSAARAALEQAEALLPEDDPVAKLGVKHRKALKGGGPYPYQKIERRLTDAVGKQLAAAVPADLLGGVGVQFGSAGELEMSVSVQREPTEEEQAALAAAVQSARGLLEAELT